MYTLKSISSKKYALWSTELQVLPGLYVGGIRASSKEKILNDNGITHILSIHDRAAPVFKVINH